jgi:hypothetical protein
MSQELPQEVRDAVEQFKQLLDHLSDQHKKLFMDEITNTVFIYLAALQDTAKLSDDYMVIWLMQTYTMAKKVVKEVNEAMKGDATNAH